MNGIKSPLSIGTPFSSPLQQNYSNQKVSRVHPGSSCRLLDFAMLTFPVSSQPPGDSFGGETDSQSEIFTSINANVVSSQKLSRIIFPPTFPCAPQNPPAVGCSGCSSTAHHAALWCVRLVSFNSVCNSCYPGNSLTWKTSYTGTYSAANIAVVGI